MDHSNGETRKRDVLKHGLHKAASKLGLSLSQSQSEPACFYETTMVSDVTASMPMPDIAQSYNYANSHYPVAPSWSSTDNPAEPGSRAKPDSRTSGRKGNGQYDRLNNSSESSSQDSNGKKTKKKTKVEDSQTGASNDSKQKKSESRWH